MASYRKHTGGIKEFGHPGFELEDTESSIEFKKSLLLNYYLKDPFEMVNRKKLKKYVKFHKLSIIVNKIFSLAILYIDDKNKTKEFINEKNIDKFEDELPQGKYKLIISVKYFLLFTKKTSMSINLNQDVKKTYKI